MLLPSSVVPTAFLTRTDSHEVLFRSATRFSASITSSLLRKLMIISSKAVSIFSSVRGHAADSGASAVCCHRAFPGSHISWAVASLHCPDFPPFYAKHALKFLKRKICYFIPSGLLYVVSSRTVSWFSLWWDYFVSITGNSVLYAHHVCQGYHQKMNNKYHKLKYLKNHHKILGPDRYGHVGADADTSISDQENSDIWYICDILCIIFWMWLSNMCDKDT